MCYKAWDIVLMELKTQGGWGGVVYGADMPINGTRIVEKYQKMLESMV